MLVQFRHVDFNDSFSFQGKMYIKWNKGRGKLDPIRTSVHNRAEYRYFKKSDIVLIGDEITAENAWMEVKCEHEIIPFDNDKQCIHCGKECKGLNIEGLTKKQIEEIYQFRD